MLSRGKGGSIVNISSVASKCPSEGVAAYCASKGALDQLSRVMALELGPHRVIKASCTYKILNSFLKTVSGMMISILSF